ncbi:MAG TPA: exodeoxyribonuclease VII large subunit [Bryobacteraceae bacterium]|nr:exodeoxyribonuclease VII large subunit [Bryobacteraceae bacterium]
MEQIALSFEPSRRSYTVSELSGRIRGLLADQFTDIWVAGEISGCRMASSGHCYFTLKDEEAQMQCVCFRGAMRWLKFKPKDGVAVLARGSIDLYEARGQYQLIVEALEPQGHGALQFAFDQLKRKLAAEGLFDEARKRKLPKLPRRIGIVTSPAGAVIRDILNVLERRFPGLHVRLWPAMVQGEGSVEAVCRGIEYFSRSGWAQVLIVARGGGSLEDLWTFNEEPVARAIVACAVPVISAVGHETDFTIADFVADLRAPTPSAAAELVICTRQELLDSLAGCEKRMLQGFRYRLAMATRALHERGADRAVTALHRRIGRAQQRVDDFEYRLRECIRRTIEARRRRLETVTARLRALDLRVRFGQGRQRVQAADARLVQASRMRVARERARLEPAIAHLTQLSPLRILDRGYAIVLNEAGQAVKTPEQAPAGAEVSIRIARGSLAARVTRAEQT